jgi:hypothetical protein
MEEWRNGIRRGGWKNGKMEEWKDGMVKFSVNLCVNLCEALW